MKHLRKIFSMALVAILMLSCFTTLSFADEILTEGDYEYTVTDGEATITKYIGEDSDVTIPSMLGGFPVTTVGYAAFNCCHALISITIPSEIISVEEMAFVGCMNLRYIYFSDGIIEIGKAAFYGCSSLTSITIPNGITSLAPELFAYCENLTTIVIPDGVITISGKTFAGCFALKQITIPNTVTKIAASAFDESVHLLLEQEVLDIVIFAESDTEAQRYAEEYGISFVAITEYTTETLGDINGDESINAEDALLALQHSVHLIDLRGDSLSMADMNQDDSINAQDALQILQLSVGL